MVVAFHDNDASPRNPLCNAILRAPLNADTDRLGIIRAQPISRDRTTEETQRRSGDGSAINALYRLPPRLTMTTNAAVSGWPRPIMTEASQGSGKMRPK